MSDETEGEPKPSGRPSEFSQVVADQICENLADGKSLRSICLTDDMPAKSTVFRWLAANEAFRDQYIRAREAQADSLFEDSLDIADDGTRDYIATENGPVVNHDHIARARLRVDTRKWMAGKLQPKKYGDRILTQSQQLDEHGKPITPGPTYIIAREEAAQIGKDLDTEV